MSEQKAERLHYLDSLRGFLMTMGIFLHAGAVAAALWAPLVVSYFSTLFRMSLFFFIGGFFVAQVVSRKGMSAVLRDRILRLGVPMVVFIVLVNPLSNFLLYRADYGDASFLDFISPSFKYPAGVPEAMNWHLQVWFLVTLLVYSMLSPVVIPMARFIAQSSPVGWLLKRPERYALLLMAVIMTVAFVGARSAHFVLFQRYLQGGPWNFQVQALLWYFPYFVFGAVAFMNRAVFDLMHKVRWVHIVLAALALGFTALIYDWLKATHGLAAAEFVDHLCKGFAGFVICSLVLTLTKRWFSKASHFGRICSEASYTVFLVHYIAISVVYYALVKAELLDMPGLALYVGTVAVVYAFCLFVHFYGVNRFRILGLLINGRSMFPKKAVQPPSLTAQPDPALRPVTRTVQAPSVR